LRDIRFGDLGSPLLLCWSILFQCIYTPSCLFRTFHKSATPFSFLVIPNQGRSFSSPFSFSRFSSCRTPERPSMGRIHFLILSFKVSLIFLDRCSNRLGLTSNKDQSSAGFPPLAFPHSSPSMTPKTPPSSKTRPSFCQLSDFTVRDSPAGIFLSRTPFWLLTQLLFGDRPFVPFDFLSSLRYGELFSLGLFPCPLPSVCLKWSALGSLFSLM